MHVALIGNLNPPHSTENELLRAWRNNGHTVMVVQEGEPDQLDHLIELIRHPDAHLLPIDLVSWTRTGSLAAKNGDAAYWKLIATAALNGVPIISYHLDRWWGLSREDEIKTSPFFRTNLVCTADGGHDAQWAKAGVNHAWFPPAISERNCYLGTPQPRFTSDIAFVGSWQPGYHPEWGHRDRLVRWLRHNYDRRVKFWPEPGQHAIRGPDLNDLYASVKVVVGDSCLVPKPDGSPMTHYCSDRIPETLGRGGMLVHPSVEGIDDLFEHKFFEYKLGDFGGAAQQIHYLIEGFEKGWGTNEGRPGGYRQQLSDFIRENHTYEVRMRQLVDVLNERGLL